MSSRVRARKSLSSLGPKLSKAEADTNRIMQDFIKAGVLHKATDTGLFDITSREKIKSLDPEALRETVELVLHKLCNLDSDVQLIKLMAANIQAEQDLHGSNSNEVSETLNDAEERFNLESKAMRKKIKLLGDDNAKMEQQISSLQNTIASLERENQNNSTGKAEAQLQIENLVKSVKKLQRQVDGAQEDVKREESFRVDLETSLNLALDRSHELQLENDNLSQELLKVKSDFTACEQERDSLRGIANKKKQKRTQMENMIQKLKDRLAKKESEASLLSSERDVLVEKLTLAQDDYRSLNDQLTAMQSRHRDRLASADRLEEENTKLQALVDSSTKQMDDVVRQYEERLELQKQCFDETDRIIDLKEKLRHESYYREELQAKLEASVAEVDRLRRELNEKESRWQYEMNSRDEKLKEVQVNLLSCLNEKQKSADERGALINEVNKCVNRLTEEKDRLDNQLTDAKVEMDAIGFARSNMEMENARLRERLTQLEQQSSSFTSWDNAFNELVDSKKRIAYERGKLQTRVEQLQQELEAVTDSQSQHSQLKRSFTNLETKYSQSLTHLFPQTLTAKFKIFDHRPTNLLTKFQFFVQTQSDLSQCRLQVQSLESQIRQRDENIQRKEKDFHLAIQSRDEAVKEAQRLLGHVEAVEERERKRVAAIQVSLDEAKADNQRVRDSLESMMKSHSQLQHAIELLQTELGQKDATIQLLRDEKNELTEKQRKLLSEVTTLTTRVGDLENLDRNELQPLRQSLQTARAESTRLSNQIESTQRELGECRGKIRLLEEEAERREKRNEELVRTREQEEQDHKVEIHGYEERLEGLRAQLTKERETSWKRSDKDMTDLRRQLDDAYRKNGELSRNCSSLRHQISELEYQLKDANNKVNNHQHIKDDAQKTKGELDEANSKLRRLREERDRIDEERKLYHRKNREMALSLESYVEQVALLQKEMLIMKKETVLEQPGSPAVGRSEVTSRFSGEGDTSVSTFLHAEGVPRFAVRDAISKEGGLGPGDITNKAQEILQTSRKTMGRLSDYIMSHETHSQGIMDLRDSRGGSQLQLNKPDSLMSAYRAERDFSRYIQDQINDIKSSSLRNLEELRSELMLEDLRSNTNAQ